MVYGHVPNFRFHKVFGNACFPFLSSYNQNKLQFHFAHCAFLGYSSKHKGYLCMHSYEKIYVAYDVIFNETDFPFSGGFPTNSTPTESPSSLCTQPPTPIPVMIPTRTCYDSYAPLSSKAPVSFVPFQKVMILLLIKLLLLIHRVLLLRVKLPVQLLVQGVQT